MTDDGTSVSVGRRVGVAQVEEAALAVTLISAAQIDGPNKIDISERPAIVARKTLRVAVHLAGALADAPKDRSADYLCGSKDHPTLVRFAQAMAKASIEVILSNANRMRRTNCDERSRGRPRDISPAAETSRKLSIGLSAGGAALIF